MSMISHDYGYTAQDAIKDFTKAIELNPVFTMAYEGRAKVYADIGDAHSAIRDFEKVIELEPKTKRVYGYISALYTHLYNEGKTIGISNKTLFTYADKAVKYLEEMEKLSD